MKRIRTSARAIFAALVLATLLSLVIGAVQISSGLNRSVRESAFQQEVALVATALKLGLTNDLLSGNFFEATERTKALLGHGREQHIRVEISDPAGNLVFGYGSFGSANPEKVKNLEEKIYFNEELGSVAYQIRLSYVPESAHARLAGGTVFSSVPVSAWVLLVATLGGLLALIVLFGRWVSQSILDLVGGKRSRAPVLFRRLRLEELDLIGEAMSRLSEATRKAAISKVAAQVAHDIRSPLTALKMTVDSADTLSEPLRRLLKGAVDRINDITNNLTGSRTGPSASQAGELRPHLLAELLESIVAEKRAQYSDRRGVVLDLNTSKSPYASFGLVDRVEFSRALSNLIDNAFEAIEGSGRVSVSLEKSGEAYRIRIEDTGKGMPLETLVRAGQMGNTAGKAQGSGLGLYHAFDVLRRHGGTIDIQSEPGKGTHVTLSVKSAHPPAWFTSQLLLERGQEIVVVDDDSSIHDVWSQRMSEVAQHGIAVRHLSSPESYREFAQQADQRKRTILIDYEFAQSAENGLSLVDSVPLNGTAVLVTSHYEEADVQRRALALKMRILPKPLVPYVPIEMGEAQL
ncbi:HAMP domain-containing histidine kinase [bacterium]|nr:HAMP domain-containing histidine kinase [bacterium]